MEIAALVGIWASLAAWVFAGRTTLRHYRMANGTLPLVRTIIVMSGIGSLVAILRISGLLWVETDTAKHTGSLIVSVAFILQAFAVYRFGRLVRRSDAHSAVGAEIPLAPVISQEE